MGRDRGVDSEEKEESKVYSESKGCKEEGADDAHYDHSKAKKKKKKKRREEYEEEKQEGEVSSKKSRGMESNDSDLIKEHQDQKEKKKKKMKEDSYKLHKTTETVGESEGESREHSEKKHKKKKKKDKDRKRYSSGDEAMKDSLNKADVRTKTEDGKEKPKQTEKASSGPVTAGQWSSANFEDSERQEKFFRLLGGYKKKEDSHSLFKSKFANTAMGRNEERTMERNLESQYSEAMEKRRAGRGMGLGYSAASDPSTKDVFIDKDKVRSIKFEAATD